MCMKKPKTPELPAPTPMAVQPADVEAEDRSAEKERKKRGRSTTELEDRAASILGAASTGTRNTLG